MKVSYISGIPFNLLVKSQSVIIESVSEYRILNPLSVIAFINLNNYILAKEVTAEAIAIFLPLTSN